jgi:drug/metabolite transporter (DMT)-like permease
LSTLDGTGWFCLVILGVVHTGFAYCLYFSSLKDLSGQEASILSYIDPLVAVLVSVLVLHEAITPLQVVGGMMILGFTLWNELSAE